MTMGTGLFLVAVGAILRYAVNDELGRVDLETVGLILMIVGAIAFVVGAIYAFGRRDRVVERVERVERDPRDPPPPPRVTEQGAARGAYPSGVSATVSAMEAHAGHADHHEMPTEGGALTAVAVSATLHCLTGCAIGEVSGMAIGTALGFSDLGTIALAVALAFLFGYALTSLPLLRAGFALAAVIPIALASDTLSIATMEIVDNAIMLLVPGAMEAGPRRPPVLGRALVRTRDRLRRHGAGQPLADRPRQGPRALHETGIHGGPPIKVVAAATIAAVVFGTARADRRGLRRRGGARRLEPRRPGDGGAGRRRPRAE